MPLSKGPKYQSLNFAYSSMQQDFLAIKICYDISSNKVSAAEMC